VKRLFTIGLTVGVLGVVGYFGWKHRADLTPESLRLWIGGFGIWAPFIFAVLYAVNTVTLLPPIAILGLTAGLAFGKLTGFLAMMAGATAGATATFFISRRLGRSYVEKHLRGKFRTLDVELERRGFLTVLFLRMFPLIPFEVVNYLPGLSGIRFWDYWFATLLGLVPGVGLSVLLGDSLATLQQNPGKFLIVAGMMWLMVLIPLLYLKLRKKS